MTTTTVVSRQRTPARALLFYHPSIASLAHGIARHAAPCVELAHVSFDVFPDGWPNTRFPARAELEHRAVVYVASFNHPNTVFEQQAFLIALCRQRLASLHIIIPYFGPGTMERVSVENEVATAECFFKMLTAPLPPLSGGVPTITVLDAHALCTRFYAADTATVVQQSAMELAREAAINNNSRWICVFTKHIYIFFKERHNGARQTSNRCQQI